MAPDGQPRRDLSRIPDDGADAFDEWMTRFAELDDAAVEGLLRGDTPEGCDDLAPVALVATTLRHEATAHRPAMGAALRAQIVEHPHVPPRYAGAPRRRLQLAVAAAAMLIAGVAATQNALPAAAQRAISNVADLVGIDVPRPDDDADEAPSTSSEDTPSGPTDSSEVTDGPQATGSSGAEGDEAVTPGTDAPSSPAGPPDSTPGGATPADPGTPGDKEPATPAVPPPHSNGGGNGNGNGGNGGNGSETGQANSAAGRAKAQAQGGGAPAEQG